MKIKIAKVVKIFFVIQLLTNELLENLSATNFRLEEVLQAEELIRI
jgi:hypothetical protein